MHKKLLDMAQESRFLVQSGTETSIFVIDENSGIKIDITTELQKYTQSINKMWLESLDELISIATNFPGELHKEHYAITAAKKLKNELEELETKPNFKNPKP